MTTTELVPICGDCLAEVSVIAGRGLAGPQTMVTVRHDVDSEGRPCPWAAAHVPAGGITLVYPGASLTHVRGDG